MPNTEAIRFAETGGPEVLQITEAELAEPGPGQALVGVTPPASTSSTPITVRPLYRRAALRSGERGRRHRGSGRRRRHRCRRGRPRCVGRRSGNYAGRVLAPTEALMPIPDGVSLEIAAAPPPRHDRALPGLDTKPLRPGDRCLIHAAAGGTGRLLVQMAKIRGAEVVAPQARPRRANSPVRAAPIMSSSTTRSIWSRGSRRRSARTRSTSCSTVLAPPPSTPDPPACPHGTMATFGNASGAVPPISPLALMAKSLFSPDPPSSPISPRPKPASPAGTSSTGGSPTATSSPDRHTFPLTDAAAAHTALEARSTTGKILLLP